MSGRVLMPLGLVLVSTVAP